ncbi:MAG: WYL domain-containing protein, partial [Roseiflexaceae bacterium]
ERWYLRANCTLRRDERLFRVDRITALALRRGSLRQRGRPARQERAAPVSAPLRRSTVSQRRSLPQASFFPPPPDPPPGSPLVRVWLAD